MYKNLISSRKNVIFLVIFAFFMCLPLIANLYKASLAFINAADFGIYQKALLEIAHGPSWNPYVTITDLKILNDHFDPAIYLGALFSKIFGARYYGFIIFEWLWYLGASSLILISSKSSKQLLFGLLMFVFSRGLLEAIEFPIHPTTWSVFPAMLFVYFIHIKNYSAAFATAIFLATFREIYFFMYAGAAAWFFLQKNWKQMTAYLALSAALIFTLVFIRPWLLGGPIAQYSSVAKSHGLSGLVDAFTTFKYPWKVFLPLAVSTLVVLKYSKKEFINKTTAFAILFALPGILIHIVSGRMVHHHAVPFVAPLIMALHLDNISTYLRSKKVLIGLSLLFIVVASSRHTRMVKMLINPNKYFKIGVDGKSKALVKLHDFVAELDGNSNILATASLVPFIQKEGLQLYNFSNMTPPDLNFKYLILDKPDAGDYFPLSTDDLKLASDHCSKLESVKIELENKYFLILSGALTKECIGLERIWPKETRLIIPVK